MPRYSTKQREALLAFLNAHGHELLSASQIADGLRAQQVSISAVYRNLADLEREGKVRKHTQNGSVRHCTSMSSPIAAGDGCICAALCAAGPCIWKISWRKR